MNFTALMFLMPPFCQLNIREVFVNENSKKSFQRDFKQLLSGKCIYRFEGDNTSCKYILKRKSFNVTNEKRMYIKRSEK